jgi:hypothetical protein
MPILRTSNSNAGNDNARLQLRHLYSYGLPGKDWPAKGYEVQVNNSQSDWRRTGSLYAVDDVRDVYVKDNEWYTEYIKVQGKHITIKINDRTVVDYNEPDSVSQNVPVSGKRLSRGTFALQGHDPDSKVYYKDVMVRPLPD